MRKVGKMLKDALGRDEVLRAARAHTALRDWPKIVGSMLAQRSAPDRYDHGTVWIAVQGSAWAQELRMIKPLILERLSAAVGEQGLFTDLRFGVRPAREGPFEPLPEPEPPLVRPRVDEDVSIRDIAEKRLANWPDGKGTRA